MACEMIITRRGFPARYDQPANTDRSPEGSVQVRLCKHKKPPGCRSNAFQGLKLAVLVVAMLIAFCTDARAEQLLSAEDIQREIVGHSFQGRKGIMSVTLHYGRDGSVKMESPLGIGEGHWALSGNRLCVTLVTGPRKADECLTLISLSEGKYRASNGLRLTLKQ